MQPSALIVLFASVLVGYVSVFVLGYWRGFERGRAKAALALVMAFEEPSARQAQISKIHLSASWAEGFDPDRIAEIIADEERRQSY